MRHDNLNVLCYHEDGKTHLSIMGECIGCQTKAHVRYRTFSFCNLISREGRQSKIINNSRFQCNADDEIVTLNRECQSLVYLMYGHKWVDANCAVFDRNRFIFELVGWFSSVRIDNTQTTRKPISLNLKIIWYQLMRATMYMMNKQNSSPICICLKTTIDQLTFHMNWMNLKRI